MSKLDTQIASLTRIQHETRTASAGLSAKVHQSKSILVNLRENMAVRELARRISGLEEQIAAYDRDEDGQKERDLQARLRLGKEEEVEVRRMVRFIESVVLLDPHYVAVRKVRRAAFFQE